MWIVIGTIAIVLTTIGLGVAIDRRWGVIPRKAKLLEAQRPGLALPPHAPGEAPATAIHAGPAELEQLRRRQRCPACRAAMAGRPDDRVIYDGRELLVLHFACPRCATPKSVYVATA